MTYSNKQTFFKIGLSFLISALVAALIAFFTQNLTIPLYLSLFFVLFICFNIIFYYFLRLTFIVTRGIKNIQHHIEETDIKTKKIPHDRLFIKFNDLDQLTKYYENLFNKVIDNHLEDETKFEELKRINLFKEHTLETLLKVSHSFLKLDDTTDYFEMILSAAVDVIENASKGSILIYNSELNLYEFQTSIGYDFELLKKVKLPFEETFLFKNSHGNYGEPVIIRNVREFDTKFLDSESNEHIELAGGLDIQEALSSPIIIDNQIFAIINIDSHDVNAFDEIDVQLLRFFASQVSVALKNKYIVDETVNMSRYDKLTGAFNRNYFEKIITSDRKASVENLEPYALVLCDLNSLKIINDTYGHSAGDAALKVFSDIVHNSIRDTDVLSRIGGDEFIILLRNIPLARALIKVDQIFNAVKSHKLEHHNQIIPISFSYGIATSPEDSIDYDTLIKTADTRMYAFKSKFKKENSDLFS